MRSDNKKKRRDELDGKKKRAKKRSSCSTGLIPCIILIVLSALTVIMGLTYIELTDMNNDFQLFIDTAANSMSFTPSSTDAIVLPLSSASLVEEDVYHIKSDKKDEENVSAYIFLHRDDEYKKRKRSNSAPPPPPPPLNKTTGHLSSSPSTCYSIYGEGVKWRFPENYIINPSNTRGLSNSFVYTSIENALNHWDSRTSVSIFGNRVNNPSLVDGPDFSSADGKNEVLFGSIQEDGVIAVTVVWGVFTGPTESRRLLEWDMVFDQVDYDWGGTNDGGNVMVLEDIATHEAGHAIGFKDLYTILCRHATMYGYSSLGESSKISLDPGDIAGVCHLYGSCTGGSSSPSPVDRGRSNSASTEVIPYIFAMLLCFIVIFINSI
jgi:hypothetical protein